VTYSAELPALSNAGITEFIYEPLDRVGLAHTTFSEAAVNLVGRSSEGVLRCVKNLCVGGMIEAVRDLTASQRKPLPLPNAKPEIKRRSHSLIGKTTITLLR